MIWFEEDDRQADDEPAPASELSTLRSELMLTQSGLAELFGVSRNYVAQIEIGRRKGTKFIARVRAYLEAGPEHTEEERSAYLAQMRSILDGIQ